MIKSILKRDGRVVLYDESKIAKAILKALQASGKDDAASAALMANKVGETLEKNNIDSPTIEQIQDIVERQLMDNGFDDAAKKYILYRASRTRVRETKTALMRTFAEITDADARESDLKRDNANVDGNTAMGTMLQYGCNGAKAYNSAYLLTPTQAEAHASGDIHIHDFDFYALTTTCCQIDLVKLFKGGFSTGHGFLREPSDITSYSALACIAIQSNQNDQHGGQGVPNFDYGLAMGVTKTYKRLWATNLSKFLTISTDVKYTLEYVKAKQKKIEMETGLFPKLATDLDYIKAEQDAYKDELPLDVIQKAQKYTKETTEFETDRITYQSMEALVHNLNTMHSRAGAQTPFSSINYGTDTSPEGRMIIKNILLATEAGLGHGETPIFPIHIFKVKEGVNYNKEDPNYDLFKLSMRVSAKRLFPNYVFLDSPFNLQYYKENCPESEVATMGCRTRVMGNVYDPDNEIAFGRGNLSFTSINLPRLALLSKGNEELFFELLQEKLVLVQGQLLDRFEIQAKKKAINYPFLMGQGIWIGSEKLKPDDEVRELLKHGSLSIGFIGLAETLVALYGHHHGESEEMQQKGIAIIKFMRDFCDREAEKYKLNFGLLATPAEGLSGRFIRMDKKKFGVIKGVTDREYYTNGFHVPVYYNISSYNKIKTEAPYHALTNAGHISYIEMDGDTAKNIDAFESVVRQMHDCQIGYGSINHPVDRDPVCGYNGIIDDECPHCHRDVTKGEPVERIRRITGYLVGTLDRFNDAKKAEESQRVKHSLK